jgi:hypothetical protein
MRSRIISVLLCLIFSRAFASTGALAATPTLELSALLPDPAAPLTDAHDEYIRLHNATAAPLSTAGYIIRVGTHSYPIPSQTLAPGADLTLTSATSAWALTNTGGTVALFDPSGRQLEATTWPQAVSGAVWLKSPAGAWAWSTSAAPAPPVAGPATPATADLSLSELLPDPAAPETDAHDEFIEVYNPGPAPADLSGYVVTTGTTKHTLTHTTIPAAGYAALFASDSKVALSNSGASVSLFDPSGHQLGTTVTYSKAPVGQAWAQFDDGWHWTITPTPSAPNLLTTPTVSSTAIGSSQAVTSGAASTHAKAPKPAKATAVKTAKAPKAGSRPASLLATSGTASGQWLLFVLAGLTIAYVIYEFRYDLQNLYFRLRGHPGSGAAASQTATRGGSDRVDQRPGRGEDDLRPGASIWARIRRRSHQPDLHAEPGISVE